MKFLRRFFIMIVVVAVFGTSAYMFIPNVKSFVNSLINKNDNKITVVNASSFIESNNKYKIVDSFALDDGNYYYFYHLGTIDYMPLSIYGVEGVYFSGGSVTLDFKRSEINKSESVREIKNVVESSMTLTTSTYANANASLTYAKVFEAKVEAGITNQAVNSVSNTYTESFYAAITNTSSFEESISYKLTNECPTGFYFYVPVASVRVYEVVVYNPSTETVEYMSTYNQFGVAIPGVFYSKYSFLDFGDYDITFDENKLPDFETPINNVSSDITIPINANGAYCDVHNWTGKIGQTYGELPSLERNGWVFDGWYADGNKIDADSIVVPTKLIEAKWSLGTSVTYKMGGELSVDAGEKLNPFGLLIYGTTQEENASLDKILNLFDLYTLKEENYRMVITIEYDAKVQGGGSFILMEADYKLIIKANNVSLQTFSETINYNGYGHKRNITNNIELDKVTGTLTIEISTKNIRTITIKNLVIKIEFIK